MGVGVEERGRFLGWILPAGLENFYFANFGGNVILFLLFKVEENESGGVGRRKIYANWGRGSAVFCATAFWPLIPGPRPEAPGELAAVIGGSPRPAIDKKKKKRRSGFPAAF